MGRGTANCRHLKASFRDTKGWTTEMDITHDQVKRIVEAQMTICATALAYEGPRKAFIEDFRKSITAANQPYFNSYYSPDGKGYSLHFDTHPVWLLQVEGRKRWQVAPEPEMVNPPGNISFPPDREELKLPWITVKRPDKSTFRDVVLRPGDVLYIPAGTWHEATAQGHSLALTMAQTRVTPLDLALGMLQQRFAQHMPLISRVHGNPAELCQGDTAPEGLEEIFQGSLEALRKMVESLSTQELFQVYKLMSQQPLEAQMTLLPKSPKQLREQAKMLGGVLPSS